MASGTRASTNSYLSKMIGRPEDLPAADLPTKRNVLQQVLKLRLQDPRYFRNIPIAELAGRVGKMVIGSWMRINYRMEKALVTEQEVSRRIAALWQKLEEVASDGRRKKGKGKRKKKGENEKDKARFSSDLDTLFDICICHCPIKSCSDLGCASECLKTVHINCSCPKVSKIPVGELEFVYDQRKKTGVHGRLQIGPKDAADSARQEHALRRKQLEQRRQETRTAAQASQEEELSDVDEMEAMRQCDEDSFPAGTFDEQPFPSAYVEMSAGESSSSVKGIPTQNREPFPRTVMAAMRHGVSVSGLANILSSYAVDMGLATKDDTRLLVDHSKVTREQEKEMNRLNSSAERWLRPSGIERCSV